MYFPQTRNKFWSIQNSHYYLKKKKTFILFSTFFNMIRKFKLVKLCSILRKISLWIVSIFYLSLFRENFLYWYYSKTQMHIYTIFNVWSHYYFMFLESKNPFSYYYVLKRLVNMFNVSNTNIILKHKKKWDIHTHCIHDLPWKFIIKKTNLTRSHTFISHCIHLIIHSKIFGYFVESTNDNPLSMII